MSSGDYSTFKSKASAIEPLLKGESGGSISPGRQGIETWMPPGQFFEETHFVWRIPAGVAINDCEKIVCLHGIGSLFLFWEPLADFLVGCGHAVLYYDLYGRGFSRGSPNGKYGSEEHINQLRNLLGHLKLCQFQLHFVGHSMGGCLATLYASVHPENVKSLILLAPAGRMGYFPFGFSLDYCCCFHALARTYLKNSANQESSWRHAYYKPSGIALQNLESMIEVLHIMYERNPNSHDAFWLSATQFPLVDIGKEIATVSNQDHIKFFFLWGENDPVIPISRLPLWIATIEEHSKTHKSIQRVTTRIFERCSHSIMGEHRHDVLKSIGSYIDSFCRDDNGVETINL